MKPHPFKLALIQMEVSGGEKERNIRHAVELVSEAASKGAEVALLPECLDLGWTHPSSQTMAEEIPDGGPCQALMQAARDHGIYVCCGLTEKAGDQIYNSAVIISKDGEILCKHRKLNELDIGHDYYAQGDRLNVAETEFGTFGLMICADGFAKDHVVSRSLSYMGADVILSPCAWAVPSEHDNTKAPYGQIWRESYMPVAREFSVAIVGVSCVCNITDGPWKGRKCIGSSLAIAPSGEEILQGPYGPDAECIMYIDLKPVPRPARGTDWYDMRVERGGAHGI
ncbi:MAG: carbon-nitrogen hydrolase family protein [Verrucomicrobia bacterium]|nr:carbon-nitrogen hydrolase family protein [Verrucomicrobiota bacterium]